MASGRRWDDSRNQAPDEEDWELEAAQDGPFVSYLDHLKANPNPKVIRQCPASYKGAQRKRWYAENRVYVAACEEADRLGLPRPPPPGTPPKGPVKPEKPAVRLPGEKKTTTPSSKRPTSPGSSAEKPAIPAAMPVHAPVGATSASRASSLDRPVKTQSSSYTPGRT